MTVQMELWHLISLLLAFFGASGAGLKVIMAMIEKRFDAQESAREEAGKEWAGQFAQLRADARQDTEQWRRSENDFLRFQADLPMRYVLREDYIRGQSVIEAKQDALAARQDTMAGKIDLMVGRLESILKGENK